MTENIDLETVSGFGNEWSKFDQKNLSKTELNALFLRYFNIFPFNSLPPNSVGFDLGCGSGRWAKLVANRVGTLHCIDPSSDALQVARANLKAVSNCQFHEASVDNIPLPPNSMDFGYSLGVLHHVPDTLAGLQSCTSKLKPGAPFLLYLYYAFDNRPPWFRGLWRISNILRKGISRLPHSPRYWSSQLLACVIYYPLARASLLLDLLDINVNSIPLSGYRKSSFYTMRTDALDRFGTRLEQRFTKAAIEQMMDAAGLERIVFSNNEPYWCALGYKCAD